MGKIALKSVASAAVLAVAHVLYSPAALAAGLGRLNVYSALGEPLKAEIEIVSLQPGEVDSLSARLASTQAYRQANIDLNGALLGVQFGIERRPSGQYVVTLSSQQVMNEPFIDMLVELNWAAGRLVREYTFLLDPPEYRGPATNTIAAVEPPIALAPAQTAPAAAPAAAAPAAAPAAPAQAPAKPAAKPAAAAPAEKPAAPVGTYTVKRGDTLAKIAQQNSVEGVSLQQMLAALYKGNPDAFDGGNMNRLRAGRILNLPDRETATGMSEADARRLVTSQAGDYSRFRNSLGSAVAAAPAREEGGRQAAGKISAPEADKPAPKAPAKDQLRLSKPEDGKAGGKGGAAVNADDLAAKEKALKEANERIALLEKNIAAMKSQGGAQLQQQAQAGKADAKADAKAAAKEPPKPEPAKVEPPKPEAAKPEAPKPEAPKAEEAKPAAEAPKAPDAPKPAPPKPAAPPAPPPPAPSFLDELLDNPLQMGLIGLVFVLLGGYAFYAVRKKRAAAAGAGSAVVAEPAFASSVLSAPGGASVDTESDAGADAAPVEGGGEEEIDAVAEADVYMAYGRDAQAEEILKEALAKNPDRPAVQFKLLEIYAHRKDAAAFGATAQALHATTGGQGEEWTKAVALGLEIDPANPLFGAAGGMVGTQDTIVMDTPVAIDSAAGEADAIQAVAATPDIDFDLDLGASPAADTAPEVAEPEVAAGTTIDFDLDLGAPAGAPEAAAEAAPEEAAPAIDGAASIDFDLDLGGTPAAEPAPEPAPAPVAEDAGLSIDFNLDLGSSEPAPAAPAAVETVDTDAPPKLDFDLDVSPAAAAEPEPAPALDLSGISLDLGSSDAAAPDAPDAQWQEVATKLDLAKAYQDMGDKDGARELLNEVLKEGDAGQQEQARTMLEAIG